MNNAYPTPMRSTRWWITCLTLMLCATLNAQQRVEYFWNADPGIGRGYNKVYMHSGNTVNFDINTEELPVGPNLLGIRVIDGDYSSPTLLRTIFKIAIDEDNAKVEYFWDTDPGIGNATDYPIDLSGEDGTVILSLPTSDVANGVHLLGLRVYNGNWSHTQHHIVAVNNNGGIERVEYFWDTDPGIGNAYPYELPSSNKGIVSLDIPTDTLSMGIHLLGMRAFCGQWSSTTLRYVAASATEGAIERVEYYWNDDPGHGKATELPFTDGTLAIVETDITAPSEPGLHVLHIRAYANGLWSIPYIQKVQMNATLVTELSTRDIQISVSRGGLRIKNACGTTFTLTDTSGQPIMTEFLSDENQLIPLSSLPSGTYMVGIETKGTPIVLKFLWK